MRLVVQRVTEARVRINGKVVGEVGAGLCILVGVAKGDTADDAKWLAGKVSRLRIFDDENGKMNADIQSVDGGYLVVSQFTLYGDCKKGNRPSYIQSADPTEAVPLYECFLDQLRLTERPVATGRFQEAMKIKLVNDGPVTILLESAGRV